MTKEYDQERITPENAQEEMKAFLENARVGSVEFTAFCNTLEWRSSSISLQEHRRLLEIVDKSGVIPQEQSVIYKTRADIESGLRMAETRHVLADFEDGKNSSTIPGYITASIYSHELIQKYEENLIKTSEIYLVDPTLMELRRRSEAHDYIAEYTFDIKVADQRGH